MKITTRPQYKTFTYLLPANGEETIHRVGNSLTCLEADAAFKVGFDDAPLTDFERGLSYEALSPFHSFRLKNPTDDEISVTMGVAAGGVTDGRLSLTGVVNARLLEPRTVESSGLIVPAMTRMELLPRSGLRVRSFVTNMGGNPVYIGGAAVDVGEGIPLGAGKAVTLEASALFHVYNQSTSPVPLAILEMFT